MWIGYRETLTEHVITLATEGTEVVLSNRRLLRQSIIRL